METQPRWTDSSTELLRKIAQSFYNRIAPVNTVAPAISGDAEVGATITATTGTWTNSPTSFTYRWLSNGNPIAGDTGTTFVVKEAQVGTDIQVEVTAYNSKGNGIGISSPISIPSTPPIQFLTNAEKLSLPANTPVGKQVQVTDGFVASGAASGNGFFVEEGEYNEKDQFLIVPSDDVGNGPSFFQYAPPGGTPDYAHWLMYQGAIDEFVHAAEGNEEYPWQADWSGTGITLTHPAVQQLAVADPSDESHWEIVP